MSVTFLIARCMKKKQKLHMMRHIASDIASDIGKSLPAFPTSANRNAGRPTFPLLIPRGDKLHQAGLKSTLVLLCC